MRKKYLNNFKIISILLILIFAIFFNVNFKISAQDDKNNSVVLCGMPFGIKLFTDGVIVTATGDIITNRGIVNPAREAGIKNGDNIKKINDISIKSNEQMATIINENKDKSLDLTVERNKNVFKTKLQPVKVIGEEDFKVGMWVRDSCAGIGTLTFYNEKNNTFAGLGHGICDIDTGTIMPLENGEVVKACIGSLIKGQKGSPGELVGYFTDKNSFGNITLNNYNGVYGTLNNLSVDKNENISVAKPEEIELGDAQILTTIKGTTPKYYDVQIKNINYNTNDDKQLTIKITDKTLINEAGGIVQGMSGSPIIQKDKLVGAVTNVFVNDPETGYAIFADDMLKQTENISKWDKNYQFSSSTKQPNIPVIMRRLAFLNYFRHKLLLPILAKHGNMTLSDR